MRVQVVMIYKIAIAVFLASGALYYIFDNYNASDDSYRLLRQEYLENYMHLSVVACGDRKNETMTMIKSVLAFYKQPICVHVFAEDSLHLSFVEELEEYQKIVKSLKFKLYRIQFPPTVYRTEWINTFKLCATQRIFIPNILKSVDATLYVDTDILFLTPMDEIWQHFKDMDDMQLAALAPEHEDESISWYKRFAMHPYYPPLGVNSGVMLMNLTRMRAIPWEERIIEYFNRYKTNLTWGDQDLINIFFHFSPELLYTYSCAWNYRQDHCMYMQSCRDGEQQGVSILHGSRRVFHNQQQPAFSAVYTAYTQFELGSDPLEGLVKPLKQLLAKSKVGSENNCELTSDILWKLPERFALERRRNKNQGKVL